MKAFLEKSTVPVVYASMEFDLGAEQFPVIFVCFGHTLVTFLQVAVLLFSPRLDRLFGPEYRGATIGQKLV